MKCSEVRAMAESYLAGELPVDTSHDIVLHLERCAACRAELDARLALRRMLRQAFQTSERVAPSPEFTSRLVESLNTTKRTEPWAGRVAPWTGIAAALLLLILGWS